MLGGVKSEVGRGQAQWRVPCEVKSRYERGGKRERCWLGMTAGGEEGPGARKELEPGRGRAQECRFFRIVQDALSLHSSRSRKVLLTAPDATGVQVKIVGSERTASCWHEHCLSLLSEQRG